MNQKSANILTIIGIGISIAFVFVAIFGFFNPQYEYVLPIITEERITAVQEYVEKETGETIREVIATYNYEMELVFISTALSAQNPIKVEATLNFPDLPEEAWNNLDDRYFLVFPFAVNVEKSEFDDKYYTGMFPLLKSTTSKQYYGEGKIKYSLDGEKQFFALITLDELEALREGNIAKMPESYIDYSLNDGVLLTIEPSSTTTILQTNSLIIALTFIIITFGIAGLRLNFWIRRE